MSVAAHPTDKLAKRGVPASGRLRSITPFELLSLLATAAISALVLYPIGRMLASVFLSGDGTGALVRVLTASWLPGMLFDTFVLVGVSGALAILIGAVFAWLNERTDARMGVLGDILPLMPFLLPAIAMAIGWIFLASPGAGFINGALGAVLSPFGLEATVDIGTWPGSTFVYMLHAVPYAYLVISAALRNVDPALEEAAQISGASALKAFWSVSLPAVWPAFLGAALLVTIIGLSNYSIAVIIAGRAHLDILSVRILRMITFDFPPNLQQAAVLSLFMLVTVLSIWLLHRHITARGSYAKVGGRSSRQTVVALGPWRWLARGAMFAYFACAAVLPMAALAIVALQPYWQASIDFNTLSLENIERTLLRRPTTWAAFQNSFFLATSGATILIIVATVISLYLLRIHGALGRIVDGITKLPGTMSHVAIGVGFVIAFSGPPFNLAGTTLILLLVYLVIYLPEASIVATSSLAQVGNELMEASELSGASEARTLGKVLLPLAFPSLIAGWALLFVMIAGEVTASAMLAGVGKPVIGFEILEIWNAGVFGALAALAGSFALLNMAVVTAAIALGRMPNRGLG